MEQEKEMCVLQPVCLSLQYTGIDEVVIIQQLHMTYLLNIYYVLNVLLSAG